MVTDSQSAETGANQNITSLRDEEYRQRLRDKIAARIVKQRKDNKVLAELARLDPLTKLLNRRGFDEKIEVFAAEHARHAKDEKKREALEGYAVWIDADGLKSINDNIGHNAGDTLLIAVANSLREAAERHTDVLGRNSEGADEFVAVLPHTDREGVEKVLADFYERLQTEEDLAQAEFPGIRFSASVAAVKFNSSHEIQRSIRAADSSMTKQKESKVATLGERGMHIETKIFETIPPNGNSNGGGNGK